MAMLLRPFPFFLGLVLALSGCATTKESAPQRTATELLLISSASDRAAEDLAAQIPVAARKVFVDATYFEAPDGKYAISAIRGALSRRGARLTAQVDADIIIEIRAGTLSIDQSQTLIGLPAFQIPLPLTGVVGTPELALFKKAELQAVAKFGATAYAARSGDPIGLAEPRFETASRRHYVVLLVASWTQDDILPSH